MLRRGLHIVQNLGKQASIRRNFACLRCQVDGELDKATSKTLKRTNFLVSFDSLRNLTTSHLTARMSAKCSKQSKLEQFTIF